MSTLDKILHLLKLRGMPDSELARKIGISRSSVTDWKNGKTSSYRKHIVAIADILDVTPEYLLDEGIGYDHLPSHTFDDMMQALSIELDLPVDLLKKTLNEKPIPKGFSHAYNKKNLKEFFTYHLIKPISVTNDGIQLTDAQQELLLMSNTLTEDELNDTLHYMEFIKSQRSKT